MAVKYRLRKRPTNLSKDIEDGFYPQVIRSDNVDSKGLASYVTGDHGFRSAAMLGASNNQRRDHQPAGRRQQRVDQWAGNIYFDGTVEAGQRSQRDTRRIYLRERCRV